MNKYEIRKLLKDGMTVVIKENLYDDLWVYPYAGERVVIKTHNTITSVVRFVDDREIHRRVGENDSNEYGLDICHIDIEKTMALQKNNKLNW